MDTQLEKVVLNYQPAEDILEYIERVSFVAAVGPSGAGKTTLMNAATALDSKLHFVKTTTSRQQRPGEIDDIHCHFKSYDEMLMRLQRKEYVQVAPVVFGPLYATAPEDYSIDGVTIMAVLAEAMPTFKQLPFKSLKTIFVVPPSFKVWQERVGSHNFSDEEKTKRYAEASKSFQFGLAEQGVTYIINDDLDLATDDFIRVIYGKSPHTDQSTARLTITTILKELN